MQWAGWIAGGVMMIILFLIAWSAYKESQNLPKPKPIYKLSAKQFKKRYR